MEIRIDRIEDGERSAIVISIGKIQIQFHSSSNVRLIRQNRGRGGPNNYRGRGNRGRNNGAKQNPTKESLDNDLDSYMAKTKIENDTNQMDAI